MVAFGIYFGDRASGHRCGSRCVGGEGGRGGGPTAGEPPALRTRLCWHAEVRSAGVGQITAWAGAPSRAGLAVSFEMISSHPGGAVGSGRGWV